MRKYLPIWIILGIILFLIFVGVFIGIYTNLTWFSSLGFSSVFWTYFWAKLTVGLIFSIGFLVIGGVNLYISRRVVFLEGRDVFNELLDTAEIMRRKKLINIGWLLVLLFISFLIGRIGTLQWATILRYTHQVPFNGQDPIFHKNIAFYVFSLPLYRYVQGWFIWALILSGIMATIVYAQGKQIIAVGNRLDVSPHAKVHLSIIIALIFLLIAWGYGLQCYGLLYSSRGVAFGASYTDVHAQLIAYKILLVCAVGAAILFLLNTRTRTWKLAFWAVGGMIGFAIFIGGIYPAIIQGLVVKPNELVKEKPYIEYDIKYTREAYGLNKIKQNSFPVLENLTMKAINENSHTIRNVRLWDRRPLIQTYKQLQEIRLYYDFKNVDVDRYTINDAYQQVMLSARELPISQIPVRAQTWVNLHLKYTHGYGLCMSPVNEVTQEGLPKLLIRNIPPQTVPGVEITQPGIYYGEETFNYVIVKTSTQEFDYPKGAENKYTTYSGTGGVPIGAFFRKLAFAWRFKDIKILLTGYITKDSRIMFYRLIDQRSRTVAPFLKYDQDPYLVIADGKLYWIQDAYTTSAMYPYSKPFGQAYSPERLNYIRNSVKVVTDAYNGKVSYYVIDPTDPLIRTYERIFPHLFKPFNSMPKQLRAHIRYPMDLFSIQASLYRAYHMTDPQVFYNQEDLWSIPKEIYESTKIQMHPYYVIMRLPDEKREEFLLMLPYTPSAKDNMVAWMCAKCDFPDYGEVLVYQFPKKKLIYGPMQIEARIDQKPDISRLLTLWGQKGSRVIRGDLLVIPINKSFIYVEPIYLQATQGQLPELKRVIVAYWDRIAMGRNLSEALNLVFTGEAAPLAAIKRVSVKTTIKAIAQDAISHYEKAQEYLKKLDWANYGKEMKRVKDILQDILNRAKSEK